MERLCYDVIDTQQFFVDNSCVCFVCVCVCVCVRRRLIAMLRAGGDIENPVINFVSVWLV